MKTGLKKMAWALTLNVLCLTLLCMNTGCKLALWQGDQQVIVTFNDNTTATVKLKGMLTTAYDNVTAIKISAIVKKARLASTSKLENAYFNFINSDGINLEDGLTSGKSLPTWDDIQNGYIYDNGTNGGLCIKWAPGTAPGDDNGTAYSVSLMDNGTIAIQENNVAPPTDPWQGAEQVQVTFGTKTATVKLSDINISTYQGIDGVRLSDIVKKANLAAAANVKNYYFNFIASDGFDMSKKAISNQMSLPTWSDMQKGYLYDSGSSSGLTIKWETGTPPGDFGRFYNCKLMDGGIIQILEDNVL